MALDLKPLRWDWAAVKQGDTYPACLISETLADTALARVRVKVKLNGVLALDLDSDGSGITLNGTGAGGWSFTIGAISAAQTTLLAPGYYDYDLETTDAGGVVRTEFEGGWEILSQVTN